MHNNPHHWTLTSTDAHYDTAPALTANLDMLPARLNSFLHFLAPDLSVGDIGGELTGGDLDSAMNDISSRVPSKSRRQGAHLLHKHLVDLLVRTALGFCA